jgi:hypothetical protein
MDWTDIIKVLGGAFIGGVITLVVKWDIEKRTQRLKARRELVNAWRLELLPLIPSTGWIGGGDEGQRMLQSPHYHSLRPYLSKDIIKRLEGERLFIGWNVRRDISEEIARLERDWKLV